MGRKVRLKMTYKEKERRKGVKEEIRIYLMAKNAILALLTASIYYSFILESIPMPKRIFGTLVIFTVLVAALSRVDEIVLEDMDTKKRKRAHRSGHHMHSKSKNDDN